MIIFNEELAQTYDEWYQTPLGSLVDRVEKDLILNLARPLPGEKALDLGCGTGNYSLLLAAKGLELTCLDISPAMLEKARRKAREKNYQLDFRIGDINNLSFPDESFDLVLSVTAFEFITHPQSAVQKAWRLVKKGGRLVIGVIADNSPWSKLYQQKATRQKSVFSQARFYTPEELLALLPGVKADYEIGLHFGPDFPPEQKEQALKLEARGRKEKRKGGGFIGVAWRK